MVLLIEDFFFLIYKNIQSIFPELLCNDQVFFEILKMKIRSVSITYSIRKSRDEKEKILKLENDIQILENQMEEKFIIYT
jgi:hypothetical protein